MDSRIAPLRSSAYGRQIFAGLLPLLFGFELLAAIVFMPLALRGGADFRQYYTGGYMLRAGHRHQLYDYDLEKEVENSVVSPAPFPLSPVHPAYEYLLFAPLSFLKYRAAYIAFFAINCSLLFVAIRFLRAHSALSPWLLAGIVSSFVPTWIALVHGQDSILLLVLFLLSARSKNDFVAGLYLGLGAFKPHIVLPIAMVYLVWRKWRIIAGFCVSAGAAAITSILLVGLRGSAHYILWMPSTATQQVRSGGMTNVRALILAIFGRSHAATIATIFVFVVALVWVARRHPSLSTAIVIVPAASLYFLGHDLVILLLPIVASELWIPWIGAILCLVPGYAYLSSISTASAYLSLSSKCQATVKQNCTISKVAQA